MVIRRRRTEVLFKKPLMQPKLGEALKEHDEVAVKGWKEEIDTLLVFAGLFSAVLTAFNIESYKLLQPQLDPAQTTNAILMQISAQLGSFSMNTGFVNSTDPPFALPPLSNPQFQRPLSPLAAASVGILVKQWLNQYASGLASISPQEARIRQFRYDNLEKWRVVDIMTRLGLFLIGLLLFLNMFPSRTVFYVASILVAVLLLFTAITT
ncbi:hypothetical protein A0H81_07178 [Grifola frondosa]|uniref:DUF6535 domain-containing protein n=1 Tax=Grifola frondosa TaxID=5627 RepID=A0A1C7M8T9_GRIFR|nr:hypothetical protein A0H81_07178 [Grifola frondosa]